MGNFRCYPGLFMIATQDHKSANTDTIIKEGTIVQVLNTRWNLTFVGIHGTYKKTGLGWKPIYG